VSLNTSSSSSSTTTVYEAKLFSLGKIEKALLLSVYFANSPRNRIDSRMLYIILTFINAGILCISTLESYFGEARRWMDIFILNTLEII
jgi:hypothetical protein